MATYRGSGKFVAITASNNGYNNVYSTGMHGVSFGVGQNIYATISPHYEVASDGSTITGTSLNIEPGVDNNNNADWPLYIGFPNLKQLQVRGYSGYTGSVRLVSRIDVDSGTTENPGTFIATTYYTNYTFHCGLLVGA